MLLLPDGSQFNFDSGIRNRNLHPALKSSCDEFLDREACVWYHGVKSVHVTQGEFATVLLDEQVIIGSTAASTCVICVAVDVPTGRATICHHDASTVRNTENITQLVTGMQSPFLYLVGGYQEINENITATADDSSSCSENTVQTILTVLNTLASPRIITIKLFCVLEWNTDPISGAPRCQSLALVLPSLTAFPVAPHHEGGWRDRGPLLPVRTAQLWYNSQNSLMKSCYDPVDKIFIARCVTGELWPNSSRWLEMMLALESDEELLQRVSTSPAHELPHVAEDIRKSFRWALQQQGVSRGGVERHFRWERDVVVVKFEDDGDATRWIEIDDG